MRRGAGRLARILRVTFLRPSVWFRSVRARAAVPSLVAALQRRGLRRSTRRALRAMDALWTRVSPPPLWARRAGRILSAPPLLGAAYLVTVTIEATRGRWGDEIEAALGGSGTRIAATIAAHHGGEVALDVWLIALSAAAVGAVLGALAGLLVRLVARGRVTRPAESVAILLVLGSLHVAALGRSVALFPALYADALFRHAGWRRNLELLVTDRLGPWGAAAIPLGGAVVVMGIIWRVAPRSRRVAASLPHSGVFRFAPAMVVALAMLAINASPMRRPRVGRPRVVRRDARPNILVLAADSLRDDALAPDVMPTLAHLSEEGTRFARQYASIARTMPSWVTLLTGQYPHHHGVRSSYPRAEELLRPFESVPRALNRDGYTTVVVSDYGGDMFGTANLGFRERDAPALNVRSFLSATLLKRAYPLLPFLQSHAGRGLFPAMREVREAASADLLADDAIARLRSLPDGPFFAVVFFSTTHDPYAAPYPYYGRYADPSYVGRCKYDRPISFAADDARPADAAQVRALYRGAAASVDDAAGRVLREVADEGLSENTVVVLTSDHGEDLFERGTAGHGNDLFGDVQNHVPLAIFDPRDPGAQHRVVSALTRDIDVAPTIYDLAGARAPSGLDGTSLVPRMHGEHTPEPLVFAETELWLAPGFFGDPGLRVPYPGLLEIAEVDDAHGGAVVLQAPFDVRTTFAKHRMVFDGRWKLIYAPTPDGARYLLFDTPADPWNRHDVADAFPSVRASLTSSLWRWMLEDPRMEERGGFLAPRGVAVPEVDGAGAPPPGSR